MCILLDISRWENEGRRKLESKGMCMIRKSAEQMGSCWGQETVTVLRGQGRCGVREVGGMMVAGSDPSWSVVGEFSSMVSDCMVSMKSAGTHQQHLE